MGDLFLMIGQLRQGFRGRACDHSIAYTGFVGTLEVRDQRIRDIFHSGKSKRINIFY